jgi:siderophore synthetase component/RimJ/RimL family protein N-acetyltransferase
MEMNTSNLKALPQLSEEINFNALLNAYCREFSNWSKYTGIPKYDPELAAAFQNNSHDFYLRFDFTRHGIEVYAPVKHYAESGRHLFYFPAIERNTATNKIRNIDSQRFLNIITLQARHEFPNAHANQLKQRLANSVHNLEKYLQYTQQSGKTVNRLHMNFIDSEQSLILGHNAHPLTKGRSGFNNEQELLQYSPETDARFQLHYFLVSAENITEKNAGGDEITEELEKELLLYCKGHPEMAGQLSSHPFHKVIVAHPWEARYLLQQQEVKDMQLQGLLIDLGCWGPEFSPTSSVRTVYHKDSKWMYKFSLHVKITNSQRINLSRELHRGYDISKLLQTDWGKTLKKEFPEIELITDPAFISVSYQGKEIEGFNTSIRHNPFRGEAAEKNISLLAALCQDQVLEQRPRIVRIIEQAATLNHKTVNQTAVDWFKQYLHISVRPMVSIFQKYGLACEFHQQNVVLEFDSKYFPAKLYFRDNQGFFFREGKAAELLKHMPQLAQESGALIPESYIIPKYTYYLLINNILGIVNALGSNALANEQQLLNLVYEEFKQLENIDDTGFTQYILHSRSWSVKGNLLTNLNNIDEASAPIDNPAIYRDYPNPLHKYFFSHNLIATQAKEILYTRYFPKEDISIAIRPFDIDRDLEMVHEWFNQEHTKAIWKMDGPIKDLEVFYRTLIPSDHSHSFIGEIDGEPTFTFEPYWPMRDTIGAYYEALPSDYGAHLLIAPTEKNKKFTFPSTQVLLDWVFAQPEVGKCIGEAAVESRAMHILVTRMGFRLQKVVEMPHKNANLTFCQREWYWEKYPESRDLNILSTEEQL